MQDTLWTKNFTLMFLGNVISSLGGVGLNVAIGVIIFDQTNSTILSSIFTAALSLPHLLLPLFVGAVVDKSNPLKLLLRNETLLLFIYGIAFLITYFYGFNYVIYLLLFSLISSLNVISEISGQTITAQLMDLKFMSQGYSIMSTIYPLCSVVVAPISLLIYKTYGISSILLIYIILSIIDLLLESRIDHEFKFNKDKKNSFKETISDMKEGLVYINNYKQVKVVFIFFTFVTIANGVGLLTYPYFANSSHLTLENYALLMSVNSLGYMFGGFFHYFVEIAKKHRFTAAITIYMIFVVFDGIFLLMPFMIMLVMKFILGLCGMNSANIRNTAVQASVDNTYRGKVNGVFGMLMGFANIVGSLLYGFLGKYISIPLLFIITQSIYFIVVIILTTKSFDIKGFYNLDYSKVND